MGDWLVAERDAAVNEAVKEYKAENKKLRAALEDIARQKTTNEMAAYVREQADFEDGYDAIVDIARKALGQEWDPLRELQRLGQEWDNGGDDA